MARKIRREIEKRRTEGWKTIRWKKLRRNAFRLQRRIYQASRRGDWKRVHNLQRLLLRSWSARCLAVRQVTQDNRGKNTAGVDGVKKLTPKQRLRLAVALANLANWRAKPLRRTYIPKPGRTEKRGLGIPVMADRALQALVKRVLEPEWEALFEPNVYGFRPGRSAHDALEAIFNAICKIAKYVLDADIEKCFDRIDHDALMEKLVTIPSVARLVRAWLKAGVLDKGKWIFPKTGTPQGGVISPLLANIALHGFEQALKGVGKQHSVIVVRYADDFVVFCRDLDTLLAAKEKAETWLADVGLRLKEAKTHVTHTLHEHEGQRGFDFLGFNVRQHPVGKYRLRTFKGQSGFKTFITPAKKGQSRHTEKVNSIVHQHRAAPQRALITNLNPVVRGWAQYYRTCVAKRTFSKMDTLMNWKLWTWATHRHPEKSGGWRYRRYWQRHECRDVFSDGEHTLIHYAKTPIIRHIKVRGDKSPYDGDWVYWGARLGRDPTKPGRVTKLLKQQRGRCKSCGLHLTTEDVIEVHHRDGNHRNNRYANLALLHGHCHDQAHAGLYQ